MAGRSIVFSELVDSDLPDLIDGIAEIGRETGGPSRWSGPAPADTLRLVPKEVHDAESVCSQRLATRLDCLRRSLVSLSLV